MYRTQVRSIASHSYFHSPARRSSAAEATTLARRARLPPGAVVVAGTYQIVQRTVETTCGDTGTPATVTGTVTNTPGTTPFVLSDTGGTTFNGSVQPNGAFNATAVFGPDSGGQTFTQRLEGTFTSTGFTARLNVDVTPRNCRFARDWTGTRR